MREILPPRAAAIGNRLWYLHTVARQGDTPPILSGFFYITKAGEIVEYFVSYISGSHMGNAKVTLQREVLTMEDVRQLEKALEENYGQKVVLLNFIKLN